MPSQSTSSRRRHGKGSTVLQTLLLMLLAFFGVLFFMNQYFRSLSAMTDVRPAATLREEMMMSMSFPTVIKLTPENTYILSTAPSNNKRCMDVPGNHRENEQILSQRECDGSPGQQFELEHDGGNFFKIKFSNLCVVMRAKGMDVALVNCAGFADQIFGFKHIVGTSGEYTLSPKHDQSMCLEESGGARLVGNACTGAPSQQFQLRYSHTGIPAALPA